MYRQQSLDYFDAEENLKTWWFLVKFCIYKERLFSLICKWIYGRLLANDISLNSVGHTDFKNMYIMSEPWLREWVCVFTQIATIGALRVLKYLNWLLP